MSRSLWILMLAFVTLVASQRVGNLLKDRGSRRLPPPARPEDLREIERQNTITAQILENFLERRLFPNKKPTHRLPTLDEILPQPATTSTTELPAWLQKKRNRNGTKSSHSAKATAASTSSFDVVDLNGDLNDGDVGDLDQSYEDDVDEEVVSEEERDGDDFGQRDPESLQSVESERVNQYLERFRRRNTEDCPNCVDDSQSTSRWTMPLLKLGDKRYYLGVFFKANWYKAAQYCRFHAMHLASISSQEENDNLEKHIKDFGLGNEHFWTSGTDLADEGNFFWMANGRPITFTNWNAGEPNNFRYENGEEENCMELWNRDGKGLKWNDSPCSFETYFVCEV